MVIKMKIENFNEWKARFMTETDPDTGTKIAIRLDGFNIIYTDQIRSMDSLEGIEYSIIYRSGPKNNGIVTFTTLDDFKTAYSYSMQHTWNPLVAQLIKENVNVKIIPMFEGDVPLDATFLNTPENIQKFEQTGMQI